MESNHRAGPAGHKKKQNVLIQRLQADNDDTRVYIQFRNDEYGVQEWMTVQSPVQSICIHYYNN